MFNETKSCVSYLDPLGLNFQMQKGWKITNQNQSTLTDGFLPDIKINLLETQKCILKQQQPGPDGFIRSTKTCCVAPWNFLDMKRLL